MDSLQTLSPLVDKLGQSLLHDANLVYPRKEDEDAAALGKKQTVVFVGSAVKTRPNNCCMTALKNGGGGRKLWKLFSELTWILHPPFHQNSGSDQWPHRTSPLKCEGHHREASPPVEHTQTLAPAFDLDVKRRWRQENSLPSFHREWKQLEVVHVKFVDAVSASVHLEHKGREHSALDHCAEVICKLLAVDGRWHEDDLTVCWGFFFLFV